MCIVCMCLLYIHSVVGVNHSKYIIIYFKVMIITFVQVKMKRKKDIVSILKGMTPEIVLHFKILLKVMKRHVQKRLPSMVLKK